MRRGVGLLVSLSALAWLTPSVPAQYPYPSPYGPAPMPYGYPPQPMPGYYPPAPMPYGYYPPAPMPMPMPNPAAPRVFVYGPLDDGQQAPRQPAPAPKPAKLPDAVKSTKPASQQAGGTPNQAKTTTASQAKAAPAKTAVTPAQATTAVESGGVAPIWAPTPFAVPTLGGGCGPEGCGDSCGDGCCTSGFCVPHAPPELGHGQFIGEIGANIFVPYQNPRTAYTTTSPGVSSQNDFPRTVDAGPYISLGYLAHNGWGVRADYWYLNGSQNQSLGNNNLGTSIGTPLAAPFQFTSPSKTLAAGIGSDGYNFNQSLDVNVADLELLKEVQCLDTTFLIGAGARYARVAQFYGATQNNPGGANGVITVAQDTQNASASNVFDGFGPTVSLEIIHAIPRSCFSIYGSARGSFLWGNDTFDQSLHTVNNTVTAAGASNIVNTTTASDVVNHREVSIGEAEIGLQYGGRCGPCYLFVRAGASFQRWWDVGSPTTSNGNLSFIGGVARVGIAY